MRIFIFLLLLLNSATFALVGDIQHFTSINQINAQYSDEDFLWVGTNAGVYKFDTSGEFIKHFTSLNGLGETNVTGLYFSEEHGLFAVNGDGSINQYNKAKDQFQVINQSYAAARMKHRPRKSLLYGNYLILLFQDQLSFFNLKNRRSELTLQRIAKYHLKEETLHHIALRNDSLFSLLNNEIYAIPLDSHRLEDAIHKDSSVVNHADPSHWQIQYTIEVSDLTYVNFTPWEDSLVFHSYEGTHTDQFGKSTRLLSYPYESITINGKAYFDESFYFTLQPGIMQPKFSYISSISTDKWLVSSPYVAYIITGDQIEEIKFPQSMPAHYFTEMTLNGSTPIIRSYNRIAEYREDNFTRVYTLPQLPGAGSEYLNKNLKTMSVSEDRYLTMGTWGQSLLKMDLQGDSILFYLPGLEEREYCVESAVVDVPTYVVSPAVQTSPNKDRIWFNYMPPQKTLNYSLGYINDEDEMVCFPHIGGGFVPNSIEFHPRESELFSVVHTDGVDLFKETDEGLEVLEKINSKQFGRGIESNWDGQNRFWILGETSLALRCGNDYEPGLCFNETFVDSIVIANSFFNINPSKFTSMEVDALGDLWLGTQEEGLYHIYTSDDTLRANNFEHFHKNNGLVSDSIIDMKADAATGVLWVLHGNAITKMETKARRSDVFSKDAKDFKLFPNPFRASQHEKIFFDGIPKDTDIYIHNEGKRLVKHIPKEDIEGAYYEWDLTNRAGNPIRAGVYWWTLKSNKKVRQGQFIVVK